MKKLHLVPFLLLTIVFLSANRCNNDMNPGQPISPGPSVSSSPVTYQNQIFRNIRVTKTGPDNYTVTGQARIFEANVSYVVEDGHRELLKGFSMADQGAPEWGNFNISFRVLKQEPDTSLTLILFEGSAKDGSRLHELFIPLG